MLLRNRNKSSRLSQSLSHNRVYPHLNLNLLLRGVHQLYQIKEVHQLLHSSKFNLEAHQFKHLQLAEVAEPHQELLHLLRLVLGQLVLHHLLQLEAHLHLVEFHKQQQLLHQDQQLQQEAHLHPNQLKKQQAHY